MEPIIHLLSDHWGIFCHWVTNQPTFVEVAVGVALFYVVLQLIKILFKVILFVLSGLFSIPRSFRKQRDMREKLRSRKSPAPDEEAPPFVFR